MSDKLRAHIFVSGKVQGVFFREKTRQKAQSLNIKGWVQNLPDGRVEAVFEGEKEKVKEIIKWSKKGPFLAKVENLELEWQSFKDEFKDFEIKAYFV